MEVAILASGAVLLAACDTMPAPPPGPRGSSAGNWSNDFLRAANGHVWVVNATWTRDNHIIFQDQKMTPEEFRTRLSQQPGVTPDTPVTILAEPGATPPGSEWQRFRESGYRQTRFLALPRRYWKWWEQKYAQDGAAPVDPGGPP